MIEESNIKFNSNFVCVHIKNIRGSEKLNKKVLSVLLHSFVLQKIYEKLIWFEVFHLAPLHMIVSFF